MTKRAVTYDAFDADDGSDIRIVVCDGNHGPFKTWLQAKRYLLDIHLTKLRAIRALRKKDLKSDHGEYPDGGVAW